MPSHSHEILKQVPRLIAEAGSASPKLQEWLAVTEGTEPRDAATVIIFDTDGPDGRVWVMHRHGRMDFAPNRVVFPGGGVDPIDTEQPDPVRAAAVREVAEEADLQLAAPDLHVWSRWITPIFERRRYDTWFFIARLPESQTPRDISGEADHAEWIRPADLLANHENGSVQLLAPTWAVIKEIADLGSYQAVLNAAHDRVVEPVLGELRLVKDRYQWHYPGDDT